MSTVETLERKISSYLRRWLGLPRSLTSTALYGRSNKLQLPISSLEEEFRVTRTREALVYRDSSDARVTAGIMVRTGRKFTTQEGLEQTESRLSAGEGDGKLAASLWRWDSEALQPAPYARSTPCLAS